MRLYLSYHCVYVSVSKGICVCMKAYISKWMYKRMCVRMYASVCMDMLRKLFVNSSP